MNRRSAIAALSATIVKGFAIAGSGRNRGRRDHGRLHRISLVQARRPRHGAGKTKAGRGRDGKIVRLDQRVFETPPILLRSQLVRHRGLAAVVTGNRGSAGPVGRQRAMGGGPGSRGDAQEHRAAGAVGLRRACGGRIGDPQAFAGMRAGSRRSRLFRGTGRHCRSDAGARMRCSRARRSWGRQSNIRAR